MVTIQYGIEWITNNDIPTITENQSLNILFEARYVGFAFVPENTNFVYLNNHLYNISKVELNVSFIFSIC